MVGFFTSLRLGRRGPLGPEDLSVVRFRVWPTDLDVLRHMNNGIYLTILDLGRVDLLSRTGTWKRLKQMDIHPVVAAQTITYRKSLNPWMRFAVETKLAGADARSVYIEQRFTVDGEVYARAWVRMRFLYDAGGPVAHTELSQAFGFDLETTPATDEMTQWADAVALPSTRAEAPSIWS